MTAALARLVNVPWERSYRRTTTAVPERCEDDPAERHQTRCLPRVGQVHRRCIVKGTAGLSCLLIGGWLALFGLAALILRYGIVEVLCVELAAVTLAMIGGALLLVDNRETRLPNYIDKAEADRLNWGGDVR